MFRPEGKTVMPNKPAWPSAFAGLPFDPWPALLPRTTQDAVMPFAIGVYEDLALRLPEEHWPALQEALGRHCRSRRYLEALATDGTQRHDTDGKPLGLVSDIDRLNASTQLLAIAIRMASTKSNETPPASAPVSKQQLDAAGQTRRAITTTVVTLTKRRVAP
jgi:sRNA-binding protein